MTIAEQHRDKPSFPNLTFANAGRSRNQREAIDPLVIMEVQVIVDAVIVFLSGVLAKVFYLDLVVRSDQPLLPFAGTAAVGSVLTYVVFRQVGMQKTGSLIERSLHARHIGPALALVFLLVGSLLLVLKCAEAYERGWIAIWFAVSYGLLLAEHIVADLYARQLVLEGRLRKRVAIYGSHELAMNVTGALFAQEQDAALVGIYEDLEPGQTTRESARGGINDLIASAQSGHCDRIIVVMPSSAINRISAVIARLAVLPTEVELCPDGLQLPCRVSGSSTAGSLLLFNVQRKPLSARGAVIKTIFDYVLAVIALIALAPVMLLIALAIKLDTRGPVFFVQSRHGFNNRVIRVIKFRTMAVQENGPIVVQAQRNDARVTRSGSFLRRTSLDELPQLINVLRGELSLVGPRPHAVAHNELYKQLIENYSVRHKIKPGITGWAQVNGSRGETRDPMLMQRRLEFDLWYLKNWSLWLDIRILLKTIIVPFDPHAY